MNKLTASHLKEGSASGFQQGNKDMTSMFGGLDGPGSDRYIMFTITFFFLVQRYGDSFIMIGALELSRKGISWE